MNTLALYALFVAATHTYDLPKGLLSSLCFVESNHKVHAYNQHDGRSPSYGVCQIKLGTAKYVGFKGSEKDLMKPRTNIMYAAKYLKKQLNRYHGNVRRAVAAYNAGTFKQDEFGNIINHNYVKKVFIAWTNNK